uniref:Uncharacterized protein n=1 Tax=Anopheles dirus TaxID=7168 RepID=A0A182NWT3_9DIPT
MRLGKLKKMTVALTSLKILWKFAKQFTPMNAVRWQVLAMSINILKSEILWKMDLAESEHALLELEVTKFQNVIPIPK